jgi:hypothetical protein
LSHAAVYYCLLREIDPRVVGHLWAKLYSTKNRSCALQDMYLTRLEKYDSQKSIPYNKLLFEDSETFSEEAIFYSLHKEIDPKGVGNPWAEI